MKQQTEPKHNGEYLDDSPIISTHDLARINKNVEVRIIDCRFNLGAPNWGHENYSLGHIPGALYANLNLDLSGPVGSGTGRHPLPDAAVFLHKLVTWGISPEIQVVVYDTVSGSFAGRLWFMLRAVGHRRVKVLDGGYQKWQADGYPVEIGPVTIDPVKLSSTYAADFNQRSLAATPEIESSLNDGSMILIDARSPERYKGIQEPIDPVAGHIPSAQNRFHGDNLSAEGVFKPQDVLRKEFLKLLGGYSADKAVVYCGSGVTSCHHLIAFELAGLPGARLYAGSWSEWIRVPSRPIVKTES